MTYKEKQELAQLPATIETLESKIAAIHEVMANPEFYQQSSEEIARQQKRLDELEVKLVACYECWEALEAIRE